MMKNEETILKEIVWGERPPHHLSFVKIRYAHTGQGHVIENPRHLNVVAGPKDIARGILRYLKEPEKLKLWATLFDDVPEVFSLSLPRDDAGCLLQAALQCAVNKTPLTDDMLVQARQLSPSFPKKRYLGEPLSTDPQS